MIIKINLNNENKGEKGNLINYLNDLSAWSKKTILTTLE